ncbi:MAG: peptide chain release factor N(5)-glutamine methyltransferase [Burkholderiales bacterium]|nr:peptide chain release factor N(5)-glutamine methyltransferase [Anaerolineae bacterium]
MPTIFDVLKDAKARFQPISDSASLDAQLLLCHTLDVSRAHVIAHPEKTLAPEQAQRYAALVERRAAGEPIAYIFNRRAFYDRDFFVTPDVLIPRPETELLLEQALDFAKSRANLVAVDVGTGSGALSVTFAANAPNANVYAVDISPAALDVARRNASQHSANVTFFEGDLLQPLIERGINVDLLMANLPYITSDELPTLAVSRYEPHLALDGGADGLDLVRRLLVQAPQVLNSGALVLLEIGADQGEAARELAQAVFSEVEVLKDYAGFDRIIRATKP